MLQGHIGVWYYVWEKELSLNKYTHLKEWLLRNKHD